MYNWLFEINWTPGPLNSNLINTEKAVPNNPENKEIGIVEVDPEMVEKLDKMELEELEAYAIVIAEKIADRKKKTN